MSIGTIRDPPLRLPASVSPAAARQGSDGAQSRADPGAGPPSAFAAVMHGLGREVQRGESLVRSALGAAGSGNSIGTGELIALQAGVYRYGEAVDLASRLVDRATSAVKTVLQGQ